MATEVITNHHHHVTFDPNEKAMTAPAPQVNSFHSNSRISVEHDNPFRPGSELIEEAEQILKNITIVGSHVVIPPANNDSGFATTATPQTSTQSPHSPAEVNGSAIQAHEVTALQCSTILSSTTMSAPEDIDTVDNCVVQRASPESLRPDSPLRAEVVVVDNGKVTPKPGEGTSENADGNPFNDPNLQQAAQNDIESSMQTTGGDASKAKKKKKKKCLIL